VCERSQTAPVGLLTIIQLVLSPLHRFVVDSGYSTHFKSFDLPHSYVRRKPKSYDSVIDYDMDNEDVAWLNELRENTQVRAPGVPARLDGAD
jgi:hypothetical protein